MVYAQTEDGRRVFPLNGIVPLLLETAPRKYKIVGTGFYITTYGSVMTAAHVVEDLVENHDATGQLVSPRYLLHTTGISRIQMRVIREVRVSSLYDIAVLHTGKLASVADVSHPKNMLGIHSSVRPPIGARIVTFGYPQNATMDFNKADTAIFVADAFEGKLLEYVDAGPFMKYPHYHTSIEMPHGTSGGPVFYEGHIIGINSRAWDFKGGEHEGQHLSSVVPIQHALGLEVGVATVPPKSVELSCVPADREGSSATIDDLRAWGLVILR